MIDQVVRAVPKPKPKRFKKKRKDVGKITSEVYEEAHRRADGICEWCGLPPVIGTARNCLQLAHLVARVHGGRGDVPWNIAVLCGPSVNKGTCHWELDSHRKKYRDFVREKVAELEQLYDKSEWPE